MFDSHTVYENAYLEVAPLVAACSDGIHYVSKLISLDDITGSPYADLGLPPGNKWASCNMGAGARESSSSD